jgi:hypothetical protein
MRALKLPGFQSYIQRINGGHPNVDNGIYIYHYPPHRSFISWHITAVSPRELEH